MTWGVIFRAEARRPGRCRLQIGLEPAADASRPYFLQQQQFGPQQHSGLPQHVHAQVG
jgi:hypothetical protein